MSDAMFTDWRKSSFSFSNGGCVEVGSAPGAVGVRDTKQDGTGPVLRYRPADWTAFLAAVKQLRES